MPAEAPAGYRWAETDLDLLSNSVVRLVGEGRLDEADAACEELRTRYPEVVDWLMRKAMVCEARGETERAIEYFERTLAWMDAHPEHFGPESREPFCEGDYNQRLTATPPAGRRGGCAYFEFSCLGLGVRCGRAE